MLERIQRRAAHFLGRMSVRALGFVCSAEGEPLCEAASPVRGPRVAIYTVGVECASPAGEHVNEAARNTFRDGLDQGSWCEWRVH
jgi:hypothetical protein